MWSNPSILTHRSLSLDLQVCKTLHPTSLSHAIQRDIYPERIRSAATGACATGAVPLYPTHAVGRRAARGAHLHLLGLHSLASLLGRRHSGGSPLRSLRGLGHRRRLVVKVCLREAAVHAVLGAPILHHGTHTLASISDYLTDAPPCTPIPYNLTN